MSNSVTLLLRFCLLTPVFISCAVFALAVVLCPYFCIVLETESVLKGSTVLRVWGDSRQWFSTFGL